MQPVLRDCWPAGIGIAAMLLAATLAGCGNSGERAERPEQDNASKRGAVLIARIGCGGCHIIPGIAGADGLVGPPLNHMGRRVFVAGVLRNTRQNMITWLRNPQQVVPNNAMPDMGLSEAEARDIAAYLETLE